MRRIKQAFFFQLCLELIECFLRSSDPIGAHIVHIVLEGTITLINGCASVGKHHHAVFGSKVQQSCASAEHYALYRGIFITQSKIAMAAGVLLFKICDLSAYDQIVHAVIRCQNGFGKAIQLAYINDVTHSANPPLQESIHR